MIDIKLLERNDTYGDTGLSAVDYYKKCLEGRKSDPKLVDELLQLNSKRKELITKAEGLKADQKKASQEIGKKKKAGENADAEMAKVAELKEQVKQFEAESEDCQNKVTELTAGLPNFCHPSVPVGQSEEDNEIIRTVGDPAELNFEAKEHHEIAENLGILDFERAGKVTGARFAFLKGALARLERCLIQFMLDTHSQDHGYTEMMPPCMVNEDSMYGTSQLPKFGEDSFSIGGFPFYMVPTAEVPVTNYYRDEILSESDLPQRYTAYTPCFRSEAGSHGRDTKGLIRQHQFNKVELVSFCHPDKSYEEHDRLTGNAETILKKLELPYRVAVLCTGDIGFGAAKCHDLEVWLPGQKRYREISSCSNFEDFQSRRANIRFKSGSNKPQFVHTLNGSGLAVGRTSLAILENYQNEDGTIRVPEVLQKYMGGIQIIK